MRSPERVSELAEHVRVLALESPTLPPSTHTNCVFVGAERFIIVDPGSARPGELEVLFAGIDERRGAGAEFRAIVLTHHHPDHVCGVAAVLERYPDVEVWAHALNVGLVEQDYGFEISRTLDDLEVIEVDPAHTLECVFTPGHAPGHLAFLHKESGVLIAGDLIASQGTILVKPPRGHMGDYMQSLARVRDMAPALLIPAHGGAIEDSVGKLTEYIAHRSAREEQVFDALSARAGEWTEPMELVPTVYAELPQEVWMFAAMSLAAHLEHLSELGRIERAGDRFEFRVTP